MNLLNVRYYLYERVIFHPTKCAAGSMLGTALQLLGWRGSTAEAPGRNSPINYASSGMTCSCMTFAPPWLLCLTGSRKNQMRNGSMLRIWTGSLVWTESTTA